MNVLRISVLKGKRLAAETEQNRRAGNPEWPDDRGQYKKYSVRFKWLPSGRPETGTYCLQPMQGYRMGAGTQEPDQVPGVAE